MAVELVLPYPPSANRYWRHAKGRTYRSKEAVDYISSVRALCVSLRPTEGAVRVSLHIYRPAKRGDLDNRLKVCLDSLQGLVYADDKQIVELHAYRREATDKLGYVTVRVEEVR